MTIKILRQNVTLIGNLGAEWIWDAKKEIFSIKNPSTKARKKDLIFAGRPFQSKKDPDRWFFECTLYTETEGTPASMVKLIVFNSAIENLEGYTLHPETGEPVGCYKFKRGELIKATGDYYTKKWTGTDNKVHTDHCLQITRKIDFVRLPRFKRPSPLKMPKLKESTA
jgi:hypothetical protein